MIGTDIEALPKVMLDPTVDAMTKARVLKDLHGNLGTKKDPTMLDDIQLHPDSCGIEFTTPPVDNADQFVDAIKHSLDTVQGYIDTQLVFINRYDIKDILPALQAIAPDVARIIMERGCDPDWFVPRPGAEGELRQVPWEAEPTTVMELGGHLHVDLPEHTPAHIAATVMAHVLQPYHDTRTDSWYRKPAVYRPKPYGIEYRSLGAEWAASKTKARLIFNAVDQQFTGA